ncbi:hypothetical protein PS880_04987 [Pseudomonas fluorescens]|uniref:Uncharacterized protein n=1 Tax=Pseudomonas fluorescens TaxID=294 RepID=A0A5E7P8R5_PSEFL|nr:hypothetical protein PS880_04987 [Pseudomonas fluorescens]
MFAGPVKAPINALNTRVNTTISGEQGNPDVAPLRNGGWLVTWARGEKITSDWDVYQQRYAASGGKVGGETQVNTTTAGDQVHPAATMLVDGGWLVTWESDGQDGSESGVYQQRYAASGVKVDVEKRVNTTTSGSQYHPAITALADGGWVITWHSRPQDGSRYGVYQQRYAVSGADIGIETQVNTTTALDQVMPAVVALADGGWVVTWMSMEQDGSVGGIYEQRYAASGADVGIETQVNTTTADDQNNPAITSLADNGWVVTWDSIGQDGSGFGVYQQRYVASGAKVGVETQVNTTTAGDQYYPAITVLADNGWLVTWESNGQDGRGFGVFEQRYAASGVKVGIETQVTTTNVYEGTTAVAALADGGWVVTWHSGSDIYQQRYDAVGNPVGG